MEKSSVRETKEVVDYKNTSTKNKSICIKNNSAITLIALVVTIVVLLILAGVTLNLVIGNNGIISKAKDARNATSQGLTNDQIAMNSLYDELVGLEAGTDGDNPRVDLSQFKIGDYVNYTYDRATENYSLTTTVCGYGDQTIPQTTGLKWRILNTDESTGKIDLVSATPISKIGLMGAEGYNNGVYLLNDMCAKQYSNSNLGVTARSINLEDIEKHLTTDENGGLAKRNAYTLDGIKYGDTKTYTDSDYRKYPLLWAKQNGSGLDLNLTELDTTATDYQDKVRAKLKKDGISESDAYYSEPTTETSATARTGITVQTTVYGDSTNFSFTNNNSSGKKSFDEAGAILNSSNAYWVASRYADCRSDDVYFGMRSAREFLQWTALFAYNGGRGNMNGLRPVVSLDANLLDGTKDASGAWNVKTSR